jgi:hypothetical protein
MDIFEMPIINLHAPLDAAFQAMKETDRSGVLAQVGPQFRLLSFDAILRALDMRKQSLAEVEEYKSVQRVSSSEAAARGLNLTDPRASELQFNTFLDDVQCEFGIIGEALGMATLVSRHESLPPPYLLAPRIRRCKNPKTPHDYPPNRRSPGQTTCSLCPFDLP